MANLYCGVYITIFLDIILFEIPFAVPEPHCSKFPYEEALLEKMIRMEIKVEQMEKRILAAKEQVLHEREKLKEHRNKLDQFSRDIVQNIQDRENNVEKAMAEFRKTLNGEFAEKSSRIEAVFQQREAQISRISNDLIALSNNTKRQLKGESKHLLSPVYFMAKVARTFTYSMNDVFLFDSVLNKQGDHYNPSTGVFTAPLHGIYLFTVQFCTGSSDTVEFAFEVDGKIEQVSLMYPKPNTCETNSFMKNLKIGSHVRVKSTASNRLRDDSWRWNIFSGALIMSSK